MTNNNNNNKLFKCQICNNIYNIPKSLPCGNTICNTCVSGNNNNNDEKVFKCLFCNINHDIPENGFPTNLILVQLMSMNDNVQKEDENVTMNIEDKLKEVEVNLNKLKEYNCEVIRSKIDQMRLEIQTRSEYLVQCLDDIRINMLNDLDIYENNLIDDNINNNFDDFDKKFDELKENSKSENKLDVLIDKVNNLNNLITNQHDKISNSNPIQTDKFEYELSNKEIDSSLICKLKLNDVIKFEKLDLKINNFEKIINYKSNDLQFVYDYKYFISSIKDENVVIGLNVKMKSNSKAVPSSPLNSSYKLNIKIFDKNSQLLNELPLDHEINKKFKQLEHLIAYNEFIYCIYVDSDLQYSLKIFDLEFKTIKDMKFNSIIKSITISNEKIYTLYNILNVNIFDLQFNKLESFGQLVDEEEAYYLESAKEIFIQNKKIYVRLNNDKHIRILDEKTGELLKTIQLDLENCLLQVSKFSKFLVVDRFKKKLHVYDENGKLICENEISNIQNVSSFYAIDNNDYLINDFPNKHIYFF